MSEAWGTILLKASDELIDKFVSNETDYPISRDTIDALLDEAEVDPTLQEGIKYREDFYLDEEVPRVVGDGYCEIRTFGDDWMEAIKILLDSGKGIEIYGYIDHEAGRTEYYSLNREGNRYLGFVDAESGECSDESEDTVVHKWLLTIPSDVKSISSCFSKYQDD